MISKQDIVTNKLLRLIEELKIYENPNKSQILQLRIQERLDKSLKEYYDQLNKTLSKLYTYADDHDIRLMKKLNKE